METVTCETTEHKPSALDSLDFQIMHYVTCGGLGLYETIIEKDTVCTVLLHVFFSFRMLATSLRSTKQERTL